MKGQDEDYIQKSIEKQQNEIEKIQRLKEQEYEKQGDNKESTKKISSINLDEFAKSERMRVKMRARRITRSISGIGGGYNQIIGIKTK